MATADTSISAARAETRHWCARPCDAQGAPKLLCHLVETCWPLYWHAPYFIKIAFMPFLLYVTQSIIQFFETECRWVGFISGQRGGLPRIAGRVRSTALEPLGRAVTYHDLARVWAKLLQAAPRVGHKDRSSERLVPNLLTAGGGLGVSSAWKGGQQWSHFGHILEVKFMDLLMDQI